LFYKSAACQKFKDLDLAKHKTEKKKTKKKKQKSTGESSKSSQIQSCSGKKLFEANGRLFPR